MSEAEAPIIPNPSPAPDPAVISSEEEQTREEMIMVAWAKMAKELRTIGYWMLGLAVLHFVATGFLNPTWGILLLIVGLGSFLFQEASMFIIYGIVLLWAGISNIIGVGQDSIGWVFFSLLQFYMAYRAFRDFYTSRTLQVEYQALMDSKEKPLPAPATRASRVFPWISPVLTIITVASALAIAIDTFVILNPGQTGGFPAGFDLLLQICLYSALFGLAVSLASLLSNYRHKVLSIVGLVPNALVLIGWVLMIVFVA